MPTYGYIPESKSYKVCPIEGAREVSGSHHKKTLSRDTYMSVRYYAVLIQGTEACGRNMAPLDNAGLGYAPYFNRTFAYEIYYYGIYFYGSILLQTVYTRP